MTGQTSPAFECQRCGACCLHYWWLSAQPEDIDRWELEGREDILQYADLDLYLMIGETDLWISPETGEELSRCPFLRKVRNQPVYRCKIYDTRPVVCRRFPQLAYDQEGQLIGVDTWALDNCPGVRAILQDLTPERVKALRD